MWELASAGARPLLRLLFEWWGSCPFEASFIMLIVKALIVSDYGLSSTSRGFTSSSNAPSSLSLTLVDSLTRASNPATATSWCAFAASSKARNDSCWISHDSCWISLQRIRLSISNDAMRLLRLNFNWPKLFVSINPFFFFYSTTTLALPQRWIQFPHSGLLSYFLKRSVAFLLAQHECGLLFFFNLRFCTFNFPSSVLTSWPNQYLRRGQ